MGEVWRATDSKLRRQVAIKVLPAAFVSDPERLARFEREAQVLAQLHHPNIASIFGLGNRGLLRPGMAADIAVFDPATVNTLEPEYVQDLPGGETRMIQRAVGVPHTIVNGEIVIHDGAPTGALPGGVLRPSAWENA